jgi:isopentenyl phosphate kinase
MTCRHGRVAKLFADPLFHALDMGLLPVVYGDVVLDPDRGAVVVSTEEVFLALARESARRNVPVARAVWLGDTDGVYANGGSTVRTMSAAAAIRRAREVPLAGRVDVTGGMALRLRSTAALARRRVPSLILDGRRPGALAGALHGRNGGGTRVDVR